MKFPLSFLRLSKEVIPGNKMESISELSDERFLPTDQISGFYSYISRRHGQVKPHDLTITKYLSLVHSYRGPTISKRKMTFVDTLAS